MGKSHDSSKVARHSKIEEAMHSVIDQHKGAPLGSVAADEVAALHRYIGVRTNAAGESFTPGELITAAGIVMEEVGAKPDFRPDPIPRRRPTTGKSFFFFGNVRK